MGLTIREPYSHSWPRATASGLTYRAAVQDQVLVITKEAGKPQAAYTFLCDESRLIMPAFVRKRPGEWEYVCDDSDAGPRTTLSVSCGQDPFKVPVGKAGIAGVLAGRGFYSLEEGPRGGQHLRFLERKDDEKGPLREIFRLIFDDYGMPRYDGRLRESYERRLYLATPKAAQPASRSQPKKQ